MSLINARLLARIASVKNLGTADWEKFLANLADLIGR
jgi:hypothetical protein